MLQRVTITNDSDAPIVVVALDLTGQEVREDVPTHVLPGRAARLLVHEARYLAVYADAAPRAPELEPDLRIEADDVAAEDAVADA